MFIQPTAFQQPLRTIPENKSTVFGIAHFTQLIDADAGIGCGFFQRQIAFLPNRDFFHRQNLRIFVCNQQTVTVVENFFCGDCAGSSRIYFFLSVTSYMVTDRKITWNDAAFWQIQGVTNPVTNCVKWPFKTEILFAGHLRL